MQPVSRRRWRVRQPDPALVDILSRETGLPGLGAALIVNRGMVTAATANRFLTSYLAEIHDPFLLLGMDRAVERLATAVKKREKICVYGDYDVDGVTAVALLMSFFREIGADCFYHIPKRLEHGYGLSREGIQSAATEGAAVIITVDCGITAVEESAFCSSLGIDLIITDHHAPAPTLPDAYTVINPHQPGCPFPFKSLAGVGVAFYLLVALRARLRQDNLLTGKDQPDLRNYLDLVALGTVADIVPLVDVNRIFVKYGLQRLTQSPRVGVAALKATAAVTGPVTCGVVGFRLAPRLNAAGRLEDAALGVELLLTAEPAKAAHIAALLETSNSERQELEKEILADVLSTVRASRTLAGMKSIVLASTDWHPGVIGIVASRIVDMYHRPTILITLRDGSGKGSGRSIAGFNLHDALHACSDHLLKFGGHSYAAGLSIEETTLEAFTSSFDDVAQGLLSDADLTPELNVDAELAPEQITFELTEMVERLMPFGMGNPEPVFMLRGVTVVEQRRLKERHLKLRLRAGTTTFEAIGFNMAEDTAVPKRIDVAFSLEASTWNGKRRIQLRLRDYRAPGSPEPQPVAANPVTTLDSAFLT